MSVQIVGFLLALTLSLLAALFSERVAVRFGLVDHPDGRRKLHGRPIALTGGPVLLISGLVSGALVFLLLPQTREVFYLNAKFLGCLLAASTIIVSVGVLDDRFGLRGRQKLFGQILAVLAMLPAGILIEKISVLGQEIDFGSFAFLVTAFWLLGAINALNLIDGVDGLATTTGIILSVSLACVAILAGGHPEGVILAILLAGALCGFLVFNFPPARMFLGDSGSMLIGLLLGAIAVRASLKGLATATFVMPTAIWAIPIFDVSMAILRRKLTGRSIYTTDRGHLHHCLLRKGHGSVRLLLIVGTLCAITGVGAVLSVLKENDTFALVAVVTSLAILVATRSFGHTELRLLGSRVKRLASSMIRPQHPDNDVDEHRVRFHGNHDWEVLWKTLTEFAQRFELDSTELSVVIPSVGEEYHARYRRRSVAEEHEIWRSEIPLIVDGHTVGHLRVVGAVGSGSICSWMSELIAGLRPFESQLIALIRGVQTASAEKESVASSEMHLEPKPVSPTQRVAV